MPEMYLIDILTKKNSVQLLSAFPEIGENKRREDNRCNDKRPHSDTPIKSLFFEYRIVQIDHIPE